MFMFGQQTVVNTVTSDILKIFNNVIFVITINFIRNNTQSCFITSLVYIVKLL